MSSLFVPELKSRKQRETEEYLSKIKLKEVFQVRPPPPPDSIDSYNADCQIRCGHEQSMSVCIVIAGTADVCHYASARRPHWLLPSRNHKDQEGDGRTERKKAAHNIAMYLRIAQCMCCRLTLNPPHSSPP